MKRRAFFQSALAGSAVAAVAHTGLSGVTTSDMKIARVRYYVSPNSRPSFSQSTNIITVETDSGWVGIGEGGSRDTVEQCGAMLIGEDPSRIEHLWQTMYRGYFYPPGREKLHALGGLDMALWDIKRTLRDTARACIDAGFRAFRTSVAGPVGEEGFNSRDAVGRTYESCRQIREGVGPDGDWAIDFHTRLDKPDAVRLSSLIEDLDPYFAEDLIRSENPAVYRMLRQQVKVPIAVGEQFGDRWDINELVEQHLIDYSRVTLPNAGGLTEFLKLAALCETHYVGLVPHFTGPVATAALVHACGSFAGPVMMEILGSGPSQQPHLPLCLDFRRGKLWPNDRPGLGVEFDATKAELVLEVTEPVRPIPMLRRPDGSFTNW